MNSASRPSRRLSFFPRSIVALALGALAGASGGCAFDADGSDPATQRGEQALVAPPTTQALPAQAIALPRVQGLGVVAPVQPDKVPVVVLSAPVTTNGGGVGQGGSDEGPRPNPWTPPPENTSAESDGSEGSGSAPGSTGASGGPGSTGGNAPDVEGAGSKSAPTK